MIELVIAQRRRSLGGGLEVGRVLPFPARRMVGPFVFFDHMGPMDLAAGVGREVDVRPHPHIGLATVTYLLSGELMHRDSVGSAQPVRPHEVNWMTAGRGITHSERFEKARREGDHLHGLQAWVALPTGDEECEPGFAHLGAAELPRWDDGGVSGELIAGSAWGLASPAPVRSPLFYARLDLAPGAQVELPQGYSERALYVAAGEAEVDGRTFAAGHMLVLAPGAARVRSDRGATVMALGGEPVGERFLAWNFVSSSKERLAQAAADWAAGRMKLPDADDAEFIPLPADLQAPPTPPV